LQLRAERGHRRTGNSPCLFVLVAIGNAVWHTLDYDRFGDPTVENENT